MNIFDYFRRELGVAPDDMSLKSLPVDSNCGEDCQRAIDACKAFVFYNNMAYGSLTRNRELIETCENIVTTFWRG